MSPVNKDKIKNERSYSTATYKFEDGDAISTSFVADALTKHYNIDRIILLGTAKSMWERVYEVFCEKRGVEPDLEYYDELSMACDNASHNSILSIPHKEKIESVLGKDSHVEIIHYGLNHDELQTNASIILGLDKYINKNDELFVDITHSFRSLPLYLMNLLIYLKNVSNKAIRISHISYGMLDISRELGYTPVVELNNIMQINEWITGAYALSEFGNGYKISSLLQVEDNSASKLLSDFSDEMNLNHLSGVKAQAQRLSTIKNKSFSPIPQTIVPQVVNSFIERFPTDCSDGKFLFIVAEWHYNHCNYSASYISLLESILTYVCEQANLPHSTSEDMEIAKEILGKKGHKLNDTEKKYLTSKVSHYQDVSDTYLTINSIRNGLAHQSTIKISRKNLNGKRIVENVNSKTLIRILGEEIERLKTIIK